MKAKSSFATLVATPKLKVRHKTPERAKLGLSALALAACLPVVLMVGLLSANSLNAQVTPKKFVFVAPVGSPPPPVTNSYEFNVPTGVAIGTSVSAGSLSYQIFVADPENNRIVLFPPGSTAGSGGASFHWPQDVKELVSFTCPSTVHGCATNPWVLKNPTYVAAAANGIWISDTGNDVVLEVDPTGTTVVAFAGVGPSMVVNGCDFLGNCALASKCGPGQRSVFWPRCPRGR